MFIINGSHEHSRAGPDSQSQSMSYPDALFLCDKAGQLEIGKTRQCRMCELSLDLVVRQVERKVEWAKEENSGRVS